ncbi:glutathione S-transferase 1-1-like [Athalia rosae]|uniref:glutathione S-transferase 1-1-like n=1 Tax=Athalia rosae TaxID=37344 RepID=UPI000626E167|nr:glutathione S-transferase 1-1-like [Athalia rosae]
MPIDLYHYPASAPCRATRLTAAALGLDLNLKLVDLSKGEHLTPEYLKRNPQHTIPTVDDNGFVIWESRAIMAYLAEQYAGKNESLYPKDPKIRAVIHQRLCFDLATLYRAFGDYYHPLFFTGATGGPDLLKKIPPALELFDKFLEGRKYAAADTLTIADLALVVTVSNFEAVDYDLSNYKNVTKWFALIKSEAPKYQEINGEGAKQFGAFIKSVKQK